MTADIIADDTAALTLFRQWREALVLANSYEIADSDDVARSFRDHVARCSDMMSPA